MESMRIDYQNSTQEEHSRGEVSGHWRGKIVTVERKPELPRSSMEKRYTTCWCICVCDADDESLAYKDTSGCVSVICGECDKENHLMITKTDWSTGKPVHHEERVLMTWEDALNHQNDSAR